MKPNTTPITRRRGRPLSHPQNDLRTPDEIAWWNEKIATPNALKRRPLPLARLEVTDTWLYDGEHLLHELAGLREIILRIPETLQTRSALQTAIDRSWRLEEDLRFLLHLHRDGQRDFAKKAHSAMKAVKALPKAQSKVRQIGA